MPIHIKGDKGFNSLGSYVEKLLRVKGQAQMSTVTVNKASQKDGGRGEDDQWRILSESANLFYQKLQQK